MLEIMFGIVNAGGGGPIQKVIKDDDGFEKGTSLNERFEMTRYGFNTAYGEGGDDDIYGGQREDYLFGGGGIDYVDGLGGNDLIYGGSGNDYIFGGRGYDDLLGEDGADFLLGFGESDHLEGGDGADTLWGGSSNDHLYSGEGADILRGDQPQPQNPWVPAGDTFHFDEGWSETYDGVDVIKDWDAYGHSDKIDLKAFDAKANKAGDQHFKLVSWPNDGVLQEGEIAVEKEDGDSIVFGESDKYGTYELEIRIDNFTGKFTESDFNL